MRADLHTHSDYSDGMYSPKKLVTLAKAVGLDIIALTDHNTTNGIDEAIQEGKNLGIKVIPGTMEIASKEGEVLGYFVNYKNPRFQKELARFSRFQDETIQRKIKALQKKELDISYDKLASEFPHSITNYNITHLTSYLEKRYSRQKTKELLANLIITPPTEYATHIIESTELIRSYGGIPVLAHSWLMNPFPTRNDIKSLVDHGLLGIEENNGDNDYFGRTPKRVNQIKNYANEFSLVMTRGSDSHGIPVEGNEGHYLGNTYSDEGIVEQLYAKNEAI